jgi:hypothetical protein
MRNYFPTCPGNIPAALHGPLRAAGFQPAQDCFRHNGVTLRGAGRWYVLRATAPAEDGAEPFGQPGLWKTVRQGAESWRVFEIPAWAVVVQENDDSWEDAEAPTIDQYINWALATKARQPIVSWRPPAADLVASWLPKAGLTVQAQGLVRQGTLILTTDPAARWTLRLPLLPCVPTDLLDDRTQALCELVADAQSRWAMVRFGMLEESGERALVAEVDLTGAPHAEALFSAGLASVRHVIAWLAESADLLADTTVAMPAWAICCPREKHQPA